MIENHYLLLGQQQYVEKASQNCEQSLTTCSGQELVQTTFNSFGEVTSDLVQRMNKLRDVCELNKSWEPRIATFSCLSECSELYNISIKPSCPTIPQLLFAKKTTKPVESDRNKFIQFFGRCTTSTISVENIAVKTHKVEIENELQDLKKDLNPFDVEIVNLILENLPIKEMYSKLEDIYRRREESVKLIAEADLVRCLSSTPTQKVKEILNGMILPYPNFLRDPLVNLNFQVKTLPQDTKITIASVEDAFFSQLNEERVNNIKKILTCFLEDTHAKEISFIMLTDGNPRQFYFSKP